MNFHRKAELDRLNDDWVAAFLESPSFVTQNPPKTDIFLC